MWNMLLCGIRAFSPVGGARFISHVNRKRRFSSSFHLSSPFVKDMDIEGNNPNPNGEEGNRSKVESKVIHHKEHSCKEGC